MILWSLGNEVLEASKPEGAAIMGRLADLVHELEPTRPVTAAIQPPGRTEDGTPWDMAFKMDVVSYNYQTQFYEQDIENHDFIILGERNTTLLHKKYSLEF